MNFLYPGFLFALLLLAIPILVHLFRFRRYKTVFFTRVKFLRSVETETKNRNRLKHLLTLCSRILALSCLVMAFAVPSCQKNAATGKTAVSIFIDNSFSMQNAGSNGILFETAREKAREIVKSWGDMGVFQILSNDPGGAQLQFSSATDAMRHIDGLRISPASMTLEKVLKRMKEDLAVRPENKCGYVISDFQQTFSGTPEALPAMNVRLNFIQVAGKSLPNIDLDSAWLEQPFVLGKQKNKLNFRLKNFTSSALSEFPVKLNAGNSLLGISRVNVPSGAEASGSIEFTSESGLQAAELSIEDAAVNYDNRLYLNLSPAPASQVLLIGGNAFVEAVFQSQSIFGQIEKISEIPPQNKNGVLVWCGFSGVNDNQAGLLKAWLAEGRTAVIIPSASAGFSGLAGRFGLPVFRKAGGNIRLSSESLKHPFFKSVFKSVPSNVEMPRVFEYFSSEGELGNGEAILRLENGNPMLLGFSAERGKLYVFTTPFDNTSTNFIKSSLFLPVLTNAVLSETVGAVLYGTAGSKKFVQVNAEFPSGDKAVVLKNGNTEIAAEGMAAEKGMKIFMGREPSLAGIYEVNSGKQKRALLAVNQNREDSDPTQLKRGDFSTWMNANNAEWLDSGNASLAKQALPKQGGLWRLFIWLSSIFFALEVMIIVFWDRFSIKFAKSKPAL
jgi:hypothetical protein